MEIQNTTSNQPATGNQLNPNQSATGNQLNAAAAVPATFAIAGIIKLPIKHASLVSTIGAVFTVLYLLDLFFDINPVKDMYVKAFPRTEDTNPS